VIKKNDSIVFSSQVKKLL